MGQMQEGLPDRLRSATVNADLDRHACSFCTHVPRQDDAAGETADLAKMQPDG